MKPKVKPCSKCGVPKEETTQNFYKKAKGKEGFQSECKECVKKRVINKQETEWTKAWIG